jgi:hypothetical protein
MIEGPSFRCVLMTLAVPDTFSASGPGGTSPGPFLS